MRRNVWRLSRRVSGRLEVAHMATSTVDGRGANSDASQNIRRANHGRLGQTTRAHANWTAPPKTTARTRYGAIGDENRKRLSRLMDRTSMAVRMHGVIHMPSTRSSPSHKGLLNPNCSTHHAETFTPHKTRKRERQRGREKSVYYFVSVDSGRRRRTFAFSAACCVEKRIFIFREVALSYVTASHERFGARL